MEADARGGGRDRLRGRDGDRDGDAGRRALTSVSCPDATFCVALDARGDAVRWNGARWLAPARVDAAGFTGVSCASAAFCAAVAGDGDAELTTNGARHWTLVRADPVGGGLTGVSCAASVRACVAVDLAGNGVVLCPAGRAGATVRAQASDDGRLVSRRSLAG